MEPIITTLRLGLSPGTHPTAPEELVRGVERSAPARDHGEGGPAYSVRAGSGGGQAEAGAPAGSAMPAAGEELAAPLDTARLGAALAAAGGGTLLRVAAGLCGDAPVALLDGSGWVRVDEDGEARPQRRSRHARLLVSQPSLGLLEIRVRLDAAGVAALVLAGSDPARAAARAAAPELARGLVRATGLRARADVAHESPECPPPSPPRPAPLPEAFDSYA